MNSEKAFEKYKEESNLMKMSDSPKLLWRLDQLEHVAGASMSRMKHTLSSVRSMQGGMCELG